MLSTSILTRSCGQLSALRFGQDQTTRLVNAIQPAPHVRFDGHGESGGDHGETATAHAAGVNALVVDKFEGRYLLAGAADGAVSMWDLEAAELDEVDGGGSRRANVLHVPTSIAQKSPKTHSHGITALSYYPFDSLAFTTSSYDHTLKLWDSTTLQVSASFEPSGTPVYMHALSPIASHLLVACATQHPAIRLVDLRTGAQTHTLAGHTGGAVLTVAWSPKDEHILASGAMDGTVRLWDVRRSSGCLGVLDADDGVGIAGYDGVGGGARLRYRGTAHAGPINGLTWTSDAANLISTGHDEKIRVWDMHLGANTFATFGPIIRNRIVASVVPLAVTKPLMVPGGEVLFYPSEREILMFEMFEGRLMKRLKAPSFVGSSKPGVGDRNIRERVTALAWKHHDLEMFSAHGDGSIRSWQPRTSEDALVEEPDAAGNTDDTADMHDRKRKRQILDDIEQDATRRQVTFT